MLEEYIIETIKKELAKQKLNGDKKVLKDALEESNNYVIFLGQENEKLKKELRDSKNGLNGANDIIKNMKKEKQALEEKITKISNVISLYNNNDITFMSLMSTINNIKKHS